MKTIVYLAAVKYDSSSELFAADSEAALAAKIAGYCRTHWSTVDQNLYGNTPPDDDQQCVTTYFEDHLDDSISYGCDSIEVNGSPHSLKQAMNTDTNPPTQPTDDELWSELRHLTHHTDDELWSEIQRRRNDPGTVAELLALLTPADSSESVLGLAGRLYSRARLADDLRRNEESTSMPHCKLAVADWLHKSRRWLPVTEAHWDYWLGCLPPAQLTRSRMLTGEPYSGSFSFMLLRTTGKTLTNYWVTLATASECLAEDFVEKLPFATDLPVFRDVGPEPVALEDPFSSGALYIPTRYIQDRRIRESYKNDAYAILLLRHLNGDVDTLRWPVFEAQQLRDALYDARENGMIPADATTATLPDGSELTIDQPPT